MGSIFGSFSRPLRVSVSVAAFCSAMLVHEREAIPQTPRNISNPATDALAAQEQAISPRGASFSPPNSYVSQPNSVDPALPASYGSQVIYSPQQIPAKIPPLNLNKDLSSDVTVLKPPTQPVPSVQSSPVGAAYNSPSTFAGAGQASIPAVRPSGISLSKAAAEAMPLNIDLKGAFYKDGQIVLSGSADSRRGFDAALFLTAVRLACEASDPYFSLDPPVGSAWNAEGQSASAALWEKIKSDFKSHPNANAGIYAKSELQFRTVSARNDYPKLWASLAPNYPNLKSDLVFRPEWLRETRFGEALYKADVLLKELSYGVSLLQGRNLRANEIAGYAPALYRLSAKQLMAGVEGLPAAAPEWRGSRLWFDLPPQNAASSDSRPNPVEARDSGGTGKKSTPAASELRQLLQGHNLLKSAPAASIQAVAFKKDGYTLDLTDVYPRMFVRRHDQNTGQDLPGIDPELNELADDVNRRIDIFINEYEELRLLSNLFRAYVIAVQVTKESPLLCERIESVPLLDREKVESPLPKQHPSEVVISVVSYEYPTGRDRRLLWAKSNGISGGVAIGAKLLTPLMGIASVVTQLVNDGVRAQPNGQDQWNASGLNFVALDVFSGLPIVEKRIINLSTLSPKRADIPHNNQPESIVSTAILTLLFCGQIIFVTVWSYLKIARKWIFGVRRMR